VVANWHELFGTKQQMALVVPSIYCSLRRFPPPKMFLEDGIRRAQVSVSIAPPGWAKRGALINRAQGEGEMNWQQQTFQLKHRNRYPRNLS
jgi:hypothetical protein